MSRDELIGPHVGGPWRTLQKLRTPQLARAFETAASGFWDAVIETRRWCLGKVGSRPLFPPGGGNFLR